MAAKYRLTTLGCKVNQYETQQIRETLRSLGLLEATGQEPAAWAVVNTCAVTTTALAKSRQAVRRLAKADHTQVVVTGCGAAAQKEQFRAIPGVAAVYGHEDDVASELRSLVRSRLEAEPATSGPTADSACQQQRRRNEVRMIPGNRPWGPGEASPAAGFDQIILPVLPTVNQIASEDAVPATNPPSELVERIERFEGHQRAFLKVQDGCDAFCTYCIIPQLRTNLRSKPIEAAVREAETLVANGHQEIIVTGIFLGAYGRETAIRKRFGSARSPLADLVAALARVRGLARLRLSSLEPGDVDDSLLDVLATHDVCVPHLHLPLQSGSADVLRRMNRQYTRDEFLEMIDRVQATLDRPAISTDIIVGFPGETDGDFEASLEAARYASFCKIHAFPFSPRPHTAAARWQRQFVPSDVSKQRMARLANIEQEMALAFRRQFVGETHRVLVEDGDAQAPEHTVIGRRDPEHRPDAHLHHGRSDRYFRVHFEGPAVHAGDLVDVRIDRATPGRTHGTLHRPETCDRPLPVLPVIAT